MNLRKVTTFLGINLNVKWILSVRQHTLCEGQTSVQYGVPMVAFASLQHCHSIHYLPNLSESPCLGAPHAPLCSEASCTGLCQPQCNLHKCLVAPRAHRQLQWGSSTKSIIRLGKWKGRERDLDLWEIRRKKKEDLNSLAQNC